MRLRYLSLPDLPPLQDISITFGYEPVLGRNCAIHFVVGINGSGKSSLLRALAEIFLCLETQKVPPFPVTIAYDLGINEGIPEEGKATGEYDRHGRTIFWHFPGGGRSKAVLVEFDHIPLNENVDWEELQQFDSEDWTGFSHDKYKKVKHYPGDRLPSASTIGQYLPDPLVVYTSGSTSEWMTLFAPQYLNKEEFLRTRVNTVDQELERPPDWTDQKEAENTQEKLFEEGQPLQLDTIIEKQGPIAEDTLKITTTSDISVFIPADALKLALCAVSLTQAEEDFHKITNPKNERDFIVLINQCLQRNQRMGGRRDTLNEVDWLWPITLGLQIAFKPKLMDPQQKAKLKELYNICTEVIREPEQGNGRYLFFDLQSRVQNSSEITIKALLRSLGGDNAKPFNIFKQLLVWQQEGLLKDVTIALRKRNIEGLISYDWLSDGEKAYLGRMAIFHLLEGVDDALLLIDEPETHFNDIWKRELVGIIDNSLQNNFNEVVLSSHSSLALTDVFDTEITVLHKNQEDGIIIADTSPMRSFGASPNEIMYEIFGAKETVGQRASEFLDLVLTVAAHPDQTQEIWLMDYRGDTDETIRKSDAFQYLRHFINEQSRSYIDAKYLEMADTRLLKTLRSIHQYTRDVVKKEQVGMIDALAVLQERIGPGYYHLEFRRRLRALRERDSNAASN